MLSEHEQDSTATQAWPAPDKASPLTTPTGPAIMDKGPTDNAPTDNALPDKGLPGESTRNETPTGPTSAQSTSPASAHPESNVSTTSSLWPRSAQFYAVQWQLEKSANAAPVTPGQEILFRRGAVQAIGQQVAATNLTPLECLGPNQLTRHWLVELALDPSLTAAAVQRLQAEILPSLTEESAPHPSLLITISQCTVIWRPHQLVIIAPAERLATVRQAALQAHYFETQLQDLERRLDQSWEQTDQDAPLAFQFHERDLQRQPELAQRFQEVLQWRIRYARLAPQILVPHVHPPTLASQIAERFRERLRAEERLEHLDQKLEAQERVYELCSHRASEYSVARTGHQLEWIIILLLLAQTVMWIIDLLSTSNG